MFYLVPVPKQFVDFSGVPYSGGSVTVYVHGSTDKANIYAEAGSNVTLHNPCQLDSDGAWKCFVPADTPLDYIVQDRDGNVVASYMNIVIPLIDTAVTKGYVDSQDQLRDKNFAVDYDATQVYLVVGTYVMNEGRLYKSAVVIDEPEEWNAEHWTECNVTDELDAKIAAESLFRSRADSALSDAISAETSRARAAEASARTEVVQGENCTVERSTAADGHDVYMVKVDGKPQVQSDWNQADSSKVDYIKNKPANLVQDADYVHTDNNYTDAEKTKLAGVESRAQVNVIEKVKVNGTEQGVTDKAVNISVPNVEITSPNDTIDVQSSVDPQTNTKTFEIDVKQSGVPYAISNGSIAFTPGNYYTDGTVRLSDIKSSDIEYAYNKDGWVLKKDHVYVITYNIIATTQGPSNELIGGRIWLDGFRESDQVWKFVLDSSYVHDESLVGTAIVCTNQDGEVHLNMRFDDRNLSHIPLAYINKVEIADITSIVGQSGGTTYTEGDGISIDNNEISVHYGDGLEVDPQTNKLKVKIGNGLKFNEESLEVEIDSDVEDVVEAVEKLTDDLDKKITTTYPFAQITSMGDFATYGVANTTRMIGQLFAVPIASEIRKDETVLCVNALQNFSGNVSFGIFEYDFEGNGGTGSTYWVADTGTVSVRAGENEFPLKYVLNDAHELQSSKLYYAVIAIAANAPASGLLLGASAAYAQNVNANPKYTLIVSNMDNYIDWSVGTLQGAWFQGYNEEYDIPRIFMMLRNSEGSAPIPVTEPFTDIGAFTLQHQYRVSDVFSLTPDANGGVYRKVIPVQDVDIVSFRYVDYHGSVNTQSSSPVLLDDTYTPLKAIGDGSWTLGDSDQTKIDGTHFVHEFTFATPVHLTANTAYWFMVGGNLSDQASEWLITYQAPSVTNDLLLVKNMYNVNQWIIPNSGEFQSSQSGMYLQLSDGMDSWTI